jgi:hypothetical protein
MPKKEGGGCGNHSLPTPYFVKTMYDHEKIHNFFAFMWFFFFFLLLTGSPPPKFIPIIIQIFTRAEIRAITRKGLFGLIYIYLNKLNTQSAHRINNI